MVRTDQYVVVFGKNLLRAVAVIQIEVENGDALHVMRRKRMCGPDGDVIEKTETHCRSSLGMMARRPNAAERNCDATIEHDIRCPHGCAGGVRRGSAKR